MTSKIHCGLQFDYVNGNVTAQYVNTNNGIVYEKAWAYWNVLDIDIICRNLSSCTLGAGCDTITYDRHQIPADFQQKLCRMPNVTPMALGAVSQYNKMIQTVLHAKKIIYAKVSKRQPCS